MKENPVFVQRVLKHHNLAYYVTLRLSSNTYKVLYKKVRE